MITIKTRRLDRMALVCRYSSGVEVWEEYIATLGIAKDLAKAGDLKIIKKKYLTKFCASYPGKEWSTGIEFTFLAVKKRPAILIKFNPAKLSDDDWADFLGLLDVMFPLGAKQVWKSFEISSLEIADDIKLPFDELVCIAPKATVIFSEFLEKGTLYLGHKLGRRKYKIYDKRRELAEQDSVYLNHDLTRVEVTLRLACKTMGQLALLSYLRPFGDLFVMRKAALFTALKKFPHSKELTSFVKAVLAGEIAQQVYLAMEPYSRKKLLKLLRPVALKSNPEVHHWKAWITKQQLMLQKKFLGHG